MDSIEEYSLITTGFKGLYRGIYFINYRVQGIVLRNIVYQLQGSGDDSI